MAASTAKFRFVGVEHAAIIKVVGGAPATLTEFDLHFINSVGFDTQTTEIDFEGDNQTVRRVFLNGITITIATDTYDLAAISNAFDKEEIADPETDVDFRTYFGDTDEVAGVTCGFVAQVRAENLTSGLNETVRLTVPKGRLQVITPPALAYNSKGVLTLNFTGEKTDKDLLNVALPSVPENGCFWFLDRLLTTP